MKQYQILLLTIIMVLPAISDAEVFQSGSRHVSVLELYTSEGCSSCPPADRYISDLKNDNRLWKELIPVAFHVDYWNYIGWPDRFSSREFSDRQRNYARSKGLSTVYTPGFVLNGMEWRSFFGLRRLSLDSDEDKGELTVKVDQKNIEATYVPSANSISMPVLNIAVLGFDLVTKVQAGENNGKELKHDFTVLGYKSVSMSPSENGYKINTSLPDISTDAPGLGIAAWIQDKNNMTPVQATGGYLNSKQ